MQLFDVHCHLQDPRIAHQLESVMHRAKRAGVYRMVCCGSTEDDWDDVARISQSWDGVLPAFGLHPWYVQGRREVWLQDLETRIRSGIASIGEIGLDFFLDRTTHSDQEQVFAEQLRLAGKYGRPVSIHCRKAWGRLIEIVSADVNRAYGGIVHSYSGSVEMVHTLERLGFYLSFSGSVTRSNNKRARAACRAVSDERLLIETDSPDILPLEAGGGHNEPGNLVLVLRAVAEIRGWSEEKTAEITCENASRVFDETGN
mgnify:CR=1 FL=1